MLRTVVCRARSGLLKQPCRTAPMFWGTRAQQQRWASSLPKNTMILVVPEQEAWVVERMGRFHRVLKPGLNLLIPILDRISCVQSLKEIVIGVPEQSAISLDNVTLQIDGVLCLRILDPFKASYRVKDFKHAVTQLAQTTMRSELGKLTLDQVLRERESLNSNIIHSINQASADWGIHCLRYNIKNIYIPPHIKESMQMQKRESLNSNIIHSINQASADWGIHRYNIKNIHIPPDIEESMRMQVEPEWKKRVTVLESEAEEVVQINKAKGEAIALLLKTKAKAQAIQILADALSQKNANAAASFIIAEQYISAFSDLAKQSNTVILPFNTGDVSWMVTKAMAIYGTISKTRTPASLEVKPIPEDDDFEFKPLSKISSPKSTSSQ
ncbi:stomatin-like protein 2, mitochondrial [Clarias gariepinus]